MMVFKLMQQGSLVMFLFLSSFSFVFANSISGTISLPSGVVAGSNGVTIELRGSFFESSFSSGRDTVVIPEGASSASYNLEFLEDNDQSVVFECVEGCFELGITTEGSWSEVDGVVADFFGTRYPSSTDHVVDIALENATRFSGVVNFPSDFIASGDETIFVTIQSNGLFSFARFSTLEFLSPGQTQMLFSIGVPTDEAFSWELSAYCFDGDEDECPETLIDGDNYATTINGNPLSLLEEDGFEFPTNGSYTDLELTLIGPEPDPEPEPTNRVIVPQVMLLLDDE